MLTRSAAKQRLASALMVGAAVSFVVAPQAAYIAQQRRYVPWTGATALAVVCGLCFFLVEMRLLRAIAERWRAPWSDLAGVVAAAHLPLYLLWWPVLTGAASSSFRVWVPAAAGAVGLAVLTILIRSSTFDRARQRLIAFMLGSSLTMAAAAVLAALRPESRVSIAGALLWGALMLIAFIGWGAAIERLLIRGSDGDWGQRAALGLALAIAVGGLLNLTWSVSRTAVVLFLGAGVGLLCALTGRWQVSPSGHLRRLVSDPISTLLMLLVLIMATVQVLGSVAGSVDTVINNPAFDIHDDQQAYLVFPDKMLQLGSMGPEPFEARRMLNLGGQSFLQAMARVALPFRALHIVDAGIGLVILLGLVAGYARRHGLDPRFALLVLLVVLALPHPEMRGNSSSLLTGVVLLISWFRLLADDVLEPSSTVANAGLLALVASGLCALKSTYIPAAVGLLVVSSAVQLARGPHRHRIAREALLTACLILVLVLPWMVSIFESCHTLLYPVLGKGFYGGIFTDDFAAIRGNFTIDAIDRGRGLVRHAVQLLPVLILLVFVRDSRPRAPALALAAAAGLSVVLLVSMGDPTLSRSLTRYVFPVGCAATVGLLLLAFDQRTSVGANRAAIITGIAVATVALVLGERKLERTYDRHLHNIAVALGRAELTSEAERQSVRQMAAAVPDGARVLATLPHPFLLDFRHHRFSIMSLPGMASLPPGLPVFAGDEAVAEYLQQHSIRYLAYGGMARLHDLFTLTEDRILDKYPRSKTRWAMLHYHRRYRELVSSLARTRKRLYFDDSAVALDLAQRVLTVVPRERPQDLEGFRDDIWTYSEAVIRDIDCEPCGTFVMVETMGWHPYSGEAGRIGLELFADRRRLQLVSATESGYLFRITPPKRRVGSLRLRTRAILPASVGAAAGGPPLGLDVRTVQLGATAEIAERATRALAQTVDGALDPQRVWKRQGFFEDFAWTDGNALLDALDWVVPGGHNALTLTFHPVHPFGTQWDRIDLAVAVNGIELALHEHQGHTATFRLYQPIKAVNRIRISSATFVPNELNGSNDTRSLGVPIASIDIVRIDGG